MLFEVRGSPWKAWWRKLRQRKPAGVKIEQALRDSEARLSAVLEGTMDGIISIDEAGIVQSLNGAAIRLFGYAAMEVTGRNVSMLMPEPYRSAHPGYMQRYLQTGEATIIGIRREVEGRRKDGSTFPIDIAVSEVSAAGKHLFVGTVRDITERKRAEEALYASEERFRGIFERAATGIAIMDMSGRFLSCNPAYCAMLGYTEAELHQISFEIVVRPEDRDRHSLEIQRLVAQEIQSFEIVNRYLRKDGELIWVHKYVSLLRDDAGKPANVLVLVTDMTERKRHEEQIHMLMREVNHRSKNMLTVVQAIARQTATTKPDDFMKRFGERIQALAASQELLVESEWKGVDLEAIVRSQLAHFKDLIGRRIELMGAPLLISPPAAHSLGMVVHELATNAGKYGALSNDSGRVELEWAIEHSSQGEQIFTMSWRERGGPPVMVPSKRGFGSIVISRMATENLDAKVELEFLVGGLSWRLECPAAEVIDGNCPASRAVS